MQSLLRRRSFRMSRRRQSRMSRLTGFCLVGFVLIFWGACTPVAAPVTGYGRRDVLPIM